MTENLENYIYVSASLGVIGALTVLIGWYFMKTKPIFLGFSRLIWWLAFADFFASGFFLLEVHPGWLCILQGACLQFFEVVVFLWNSVIAYTIYDNRNNLSNKWNIKFRLLFCLSWGWAAISTFVDYQLNAFGETDGGWCWVSQISPYWKWLRISYYAPCVFSYFYIIITYSLLHKHIKSMNEKDIPLTEKKANNKLRRKFVLFVMAFILANTDPIINRFHDIIDPNNPVVWLLKLHAFLFPAQGFFNALVYGSLVLKKTNLPCWNSKKYKPTSETSEPLLSDLTDNNQKKEYTEM